MQIGENVKMKVLPWKGWQATIIDDCYRKREDGKCTMLVKINNKPDLEYEVTQEEVEKIYG